ncbi:polysaccharide biosynthesis C-terminal domain-containing protein [Secundilactobacillus kimchicus]|uniref:polysaccharide biosynthesis C-terminal domain-containing protein n=1 Tax=Secundilactobacillus kimchicus TaxID=528209 RepID=UPI000B27C539|nr:polysaccharide biosynthesis C-terminal domain-containing protein [Secundilactobacillus kimchicus]
MPQINQVLFGDTSGSAALDVYALSVIFATLITILNSILQSMNHYRETVIALSIGLVVKAFFEPLHGRSFRNCRRQLGDGPCTSSHDHVIITTGSSAQVRFA